MACRNFHTDLVQYLLENTRVDPLARSSQGGFQALALALGDGGQTDQGLPILELFCRKAPKALEMPFSLDRDGKTQPQISPF